jgi:2'-5' RNA ligase
VLIGPPPVRSFVALPCPPALDAALTRFVRDWRDEHRAVRWVGEAGRHLTLHFLGMADRERLVRLSEGLADLAATIPALEIAPGRAGAFPDWRRPRVLWLGLADADPVVALGRAVEQVACKVGFDPETRRFLPHWTLGRVADGRVSSRVARVVRGWGPGTGAETVDEVVLYRSDRGPDGPRYTAVDRYSLCGGDK